MHELFKKRKSIRSFDPERFEAVNLDLSGGWIGGFEEEKVRKIFDLSENQKPIAILPIGYEK